MRAMGWCIERARERQGMAVAAVRDWQLVIAAPYARLAAEAGLIGFACTNFVPLVAPPGGCTAVFGTNPIAYGLPAQRHRPVVLDVATTVSSLQKVRIAAQQGTEMPEGVIFDSAGRDTTDPTAMLESGLLVPLGYPHAPHKGFGLAISVDALSGVLSGGGFAQGVATGAPGNFLCALDIEAFSPGRSSWREWTHRSTRSSRGNGFRASTSSWYPASEASDACWTSPPAAWCPWG
jgi:LDH2 family malate/lactate/ureidoglycolate dehydrogenase